MPRLCLPPTSHETGDACIGRDGTRGRRRIRHRYGRARTRRLVVGLARRNRTAVEGPDAATARWCAAVGGQPVHSPKEPPDTTQQPTAGAAATTPHTRPTPGDTRPPTTNPVTALCGRDAAAHPPFSQLYQQKMFLMSASRVRLKLPPHSHPGMCVREVIECYAGGHSTLTTYTGR